jgi:hypothetical protein
MAEDDNTRRLELIILIQGAGCSQSLDSFESLFEISHQSNSKKTPWNCSVTIVGRGMCAS